MCSFVHWSRSLPVVCFGIYLFMHRCSCIMAMYYGFTTDWYTVKQPPSMKNFSETTKQKRGESLLHRTATKWVRTPVNQYLSNQCYRRCKYQCRSDGRGMEGFKRWPESIVYMLSAGFIVEFFLLHGCPAFFLSNESSIVVDQNARQKLFCLIRKMVEAETSSRKTSESIIKR